MPMTTSELLRTDQVAERLDITIRDVYRLIEQGHLEPTLQTIDGKPGRWVHIDADQVEAYRQGS